MRNPIKEKFRRGDAVSFIVHGDCWTGTIVHMNPRRARVRCGEGVWLVPYEKLRADPHPDPAPDSRGRKPPGSPAR